MEDLYDPEEKILCPYNNAHHIRRCRMTVHLVKCKKNYEEQKMIPCDFNANHMIPEPELRYHHQICPDRKKLEVQIVESSSTADSRFPILDLSCPTEESWDNENVSTYNPQKYAETHDVLRQLDVESSAKRRNFRLKERQRHGALNIQEKNQPPAELQNEARSLPPHRKVTQMPEETKFNPDLFSEKLKISDKVYLQFKPGPSSSSSSSSKKDFDD